VLYPVFHHDLHQLPHIRAHFSDGAQNQWPKKKGRGGLERVASLPLPVSHPPANPVGEDETTAEMLRLI
jgi:hypothetical protein